MVGLFDPKTLRFTWVGAGHPVPVLVRGEVARPMVAPPGVLLGAARKPTYGVAKVQLRPGDVLLMFSDGLIERRDRDIDEGQAQVLAAAGSLTVADLPTTVDAMLKTVGGPIRATTRACSRWVCWEHRRVLMLLDTPSLYFRAYYGVPESMTAPDGVPRQRRPGPDRHDRHAGEGPLPTHLVAAMDADWRPAFRVAAIPSYKAHRVASGDEEEIPDTLAPQVPVIEKVLAAVGIASLRRREGYEAERRHRHPHGERRPSRSRSSPATGTSSSSSTTPSSAGSFTR